MYYAFVDRIKSTKTVMVMDSWLTVMMYSHDLWYGIDLFEFGVSTVHCTTWEDPNDIDT